GLPHSVQNAIRKHQSGSVFFKGNICPEPKRWNATTFEVWDGESGELLLSGELTMPYGHATVDPELDHFDEEQGLNWFGRRVKVLAAEVVDASDWRGSWEMAKQTGDDNNATVILK